MLEITITVFWLAVWKWLKMNKGKSKSPLRPQIIFSIKTEKINILSAESISRHDGFDGLLFCHHLSNRDDRQKCCIQCRQHFSLAEGEWRRHVQDSPMKTRGHQNGWSTRSEHLALCTFCRPNAVAPFQKDKHILHPRLHDTGKGDYSHHYFWNMHFLL